MGWEPLTYCRECGEAFDAYRAPEERICECCKEFYRDMEADKATAFLKDYEELTHGPR